MRCHLCSNDLFCAGCNQRILTDDVVKRQMSEAICKLRREKNQIEGELGILKAVFGILSKGKEPLLMQNVYQQGLDKYYDRREEEFWKDYDATSNSWPWEESLPRNH